MKINFKKLLLLFVLFVTFFYMYFVFDNITFRISLVLILSMILAMLAYLITCIKYRKAVFIVLVILLNILLTSLTLRDLVYWENIRIFVIIVMSLLLLYNVIYIGYEKPKYILYIVAITITFALLPITYYLHYNSYFSEWGFYGDMSWLGVLIILAIGGITVFIQNYLARIEDKRISLITQLLIQGSVVVIMIMILNSIFFSDGI